MKYLIPLAVIASLALASCNYISNLCGCCDEATTEQEAPAND